MAFTTASVPDQDGRVAVVTGANGGLGLETARALVGAGAHVVMAARDQDKAAAAEADIRSSHPGGSLEIVALDLSRLDSVAGAAGAIRREHDRVDILVNNAGVMATPEGRTADGFETQLGVNHLGHFALTAHLLVPLLRAGAARVVAVTSIARHRGRPVDPSNPHLEGEYGPWQAYGRSKLANLHFAIGLQRRFEAEGVEAASLAAHPGFTNTDLQARSARANDGFLQRQSRFWVRMAGMTPARGALSVIRAATDPGAGGGELYGPRVGLFGSPIRLPLVRRRGLDDAIADLWSVSEGGTGVQLDVATALGELSE